MSKKVFYEIEKKKFRLIEVETEEQEQLIKALNRDLERADKQEKRAQARCASLEALAENGYEVESPDVPMDERLEKQEEAAALHKAMERLTDKQREIVHLRFWDGLTVGEIAELKKMHHSTVTECLASAIKKIKKFFQNTPRN